MSKHSDYLYGRCTLVAEGQQTRNVHCFLDLTEQRFVCETDPMEVLSALTGKADRTYTISDVELWGPEGRLTAETIPIAFVGAINGGTLSVKQTPLRQVLGVDARVGRISFVINEKIKLSLEDSYNEVLFKPGLDTVGQVLLSEELSIVGSKESISLLGETSRDLKELTVATALAIGCPCRIAAMQVKQEITLFLNNFKAQGVARPLFYHGHPYSDLDLLRTGVAQLFRLTLDYLSKLSSEETAAFRNSVNTFLQARSIPSSYELQLYAAYHFLEWFDGSRTLSPNVLVHRLSIERREADVITNIRNALTHNNRDLREVVDREAAVLFLDSSLGAYRFRGGNVHVGYLNFFYSLLGKQLLREIGYKGQADTFFPLVGT